MVYSEGGDVMGLDQTLYWIGELSKAQVIRLRHKYLAEHNYTNGMRYISEEDYHEEQYKHIRKYMTPEDVYLKELDWKLLKSDCGMPEEANICSFGPSSVKFGKAVNVGDVKEFRINGYDERYWRPVLRKQYFYLCDEVYCWRNNFRIQEIFDSAFPEVWSEHKKKYTSINCGYYPITELFEKMKRVDIDFRKKYTEGTDNILYHGYW